MSTRVLVVDDEEYVLDLLQRVLEKQGYEVTVVDRGAKALAELEQATFDIVITDVVMPEIDGFELLRKIKGLYPDTKVVVLTAYARKLNISDFLLYGADEYVAKPFQVQELLSLLEGVIGA